MTMRVTGITVALCALAVMLTGCDSRRRGDVGASSLTTDVTSVAAQSTVAETAAPVTFHISILNPPSSIYASISYSGAAVALASWYGQAATGADITVQFPIPADLQPGVATGQVRFDVCEDPKCDTPSRGSPVVVPVQLTVTAVPPISATASPATISVTAMQGASPDAPLANVQLTFASPIPASTVVTVNHSHAFVDTIATTMSSPTTIDAVVQMFKPESFAAGARTDTLSFDACYSATCANHITSAPILVPLTYTIEVPGPHGEPGVTPFAPTSRTTIPHGVIDAEYSQALDAIVMVGAYPASALYVYDVNRHAERRVPLSQVPTAVSLSPDGLHAAVAHDALITYVDLADVGVTGAPPPRLLNVSAHAFDIVLDGRGFVHAFPLHDQRVNVHSVQIATNTETIGSGVLSDEGHVRLHPSGDYVYSANNNGRGDIEKFDVASMPSSRLYDSPYQGNYAMCGDLWFSQTGKVIYTACGNAFHSSASRASDMEYAGALALSASQHSGYRVRSLSQSDAVGEIALVEDDNDPCRSAIDPARCFAHVALYGSDFLDRTALFSLEPITVAGQPYLQLGSFVFYSANGRRKFLLSQLYGMQNPAAEHYLSEF